MYLATSNDIAPDAALVLRDISAWPFEASGEWSSDNARGRRLALRFASQMQEADSPASLGHVVASIAKRGSELTGLEVGFFSQLAQLLRPALSVVSA